MTKQVFSALRQHYPEIIEMMPEKFTSHQFILALAQKYQAEYVCALYEYIDAVHVQTPAPFQFVHSKLAKMLHEFPQQVQFIRDDAKSEDIFGNSSQCAEWLRVY